MAELQDKDTLTQEALALQKKLTDGDLTVDEKKRLEELKVLLRGGGKPETSGASGMHRSSDPRSSEKVKFKVKSAKAENKQEESKKEEKKSGASEMRHSSGQISKKTKPEIKEAKVIEVPDKYERRSSYSIDDIKKKIDRLDSEGVGNLRDRYKEKYGEDLYVPDLHSENVREALEDVKPYLEIDEFEEEQETADDDEETAEVDEEKDGEKEDSGPSFFTRLIGAIKAFFKRIFSRKEKTEKESVKVDEAAATAAVSNGE